MRPKHLVNLAIATTVACNSASNNRQHVRFASLAFDVPGDWRHIDTTRRGIVTSIWSPQDNDGKESVTVIRTDLAPSAARAGAPTLERLLESANALDAQHTDATSVTTQNGLAGARIETDYVPPGMERSYHRVHVVLVDGHALVHVMYTAARADRSMEALNMVLTSIHHEES